MTVRPITADDAAHLRRRFDEVRCADLELRRLHVRVRATALERGVAVDAASLVAVLGALLDEERAGGSPATLWTEPRVLEFMWTTCYLWCARRGLPPPPHVADALRAWWGHLAVHGSFAAGSDGPECLRLALRSCAPPRPRPKAAGRRQPAPRAPA